MNGAYQNENDAVGRLMNDFRCKDADDMHYDVLAERVRYFKQAEGGHEDMSRIMEELCAEERAEGRAEGEAEGEARGRAEGEARGEAKGEEKMAKKFAAYLKSTGLNADEISDVVPYSADTIRSWLEFS